MKRETVAPRLLSVVRRDIPRQIQITSRSRYYLPNILPSELGVYNYYRSSSRKNSVLRTSQCIEILLLSTTGYKLFPLSMASPFAAPYFFRQPIRYLRWASHEKPAIFYSCCIGMLGPISMVAVPPVRRYFGDGPREKIPMTYPSKPLWIRLLGECGCRTVKGDSCIIEWRM